MMKLFSDLFSTDYGLLSALVFVIMLGMAVFFARFFISHIREDEARIRALDSPERS